ncbi:TetR/AcrR family transcriptional regulator [Pseudomonas sp. CGJS7]|uniref:TetR/AcrR family transcriptional regulator n=1 Tax=Pseudomonas sp. CGJS7 TaxID=3109348 RepID=UPI0030097C4D
MKTPKDDRPSAHAPRSNRERTEATRHALLEAARGLFVEKGYGDTSTPEVSVAAGTTRGALYHHFIDKRDLFRQVLQRESQAVREDILAATPPDLSPRAALILGAQAYLRAMTMPGRTRLLLIDGPAVLGLSDAIAIDDAHAGDTLHEGLAAALGERADVDIASLATLLSAAFDRAALEIDAGADAQRVGEAMVWLVERVLAEGGKRTKTK